MPYPSHGDVHQELHRESKDQGQTPTTSGKRARLKRVKQKLNLRQAQGAIVAHLDLQQTRTCTRLWGSTPTYRGRSLRELHPFSGDRPTRLQQYDVPGDTRAKYKKAWTRKQPRQDRPPFRTPMDSLAVRRRRRATVAEPFSVRLRNHDETRTVLVAPIYATRAAAATTTTSHFLPSC